MDALQKIQLRQSELRVKLNELLGTPLETRAETFPEDLGALTAQLKNVETEVQAAILAQPEIVEKRSEEKPAETAEEKEVRELRAEVNFGKYIAAALSGGGIRDGAEAELNQHLGIAQNYFPMELLAPKVETRAARDGDAATSQASWLDRVMAQTASERLGVSFRTVAPGVAAFPYTSAGGSPVQRGRTEAVAESTYTVAVEEMKPTRAAINGKYSIEDDMRLPGMSEAIERDMRAAMAEQIDRVIFLGDSGANEDTADITGLNTFDSVAEPTLTQANKVKADETLKVFLTQLDGVYAASLADLRVVASRGANSLWYGTIHAAAVDNQTVAQFLMASGLAWTMRGEIENNTANGDFGAFFGLGRGIEGAAIAAVWDAGQLIRDPYSGAKTGEVELTLNYLWNFKVIRTANFKRLKFVT